MRTRTVSVSDKMQKGYRYVRSAPAGRGFDPDFKPQLTPAQMLSLGIFGGKYMTDCRREFPKSWFARAKLSPRGYDRDCNFFGVDSRISRRAIKPGAASTPACRIPPPSSLRVRRARLMKSREPTTSDPTGAQSPSLIHIEIELACATRSRRGAT